MKRGYRLVKLILGCVIGLMGIQHLEAQQAQEGQLYAGTAKVNITPKTDMVVHDSLYARGMVLEVGKERWAFVSVDMGIYHNEDLIQQCKDKYGLTKVFIASSHTHSSGRPDTTLVKNQIVAMVGKAVASKFPAFLSAGHRKFPQLGFNRTIVREDGHARESWFGDDHYRSENPERIPFGPVDPEVGVIKVEDAQGKIRGMLLNYAMHADVVCLNYEISADYPGMVCKKVEEAFGPQMHCLFVQGAGGDIESLIISSRRKGPDDSFKTDYHTIDRVGELLAYEAIKLANSLTAEHGPTSLAHVDSSFDFKGRFTKDQQYHLYTSTLLINHDIVIGTCPGEPFVELQLDWKNKIRQADGIPFLFGYTWQHGTWPNYIPDIRSAAQGGYGADQNTPVMIQVGAGERIMDQHFENYFVLNGLMRQEPGPVGFKGESRWIMQEVPREHQD